MLTWSFHHKRDILESRFYKKQQLKENELKLKAAEKLNYFKNLSDAQVEAAQIKVTKKNSTHLKNA